ncbi:MAG TPA: RecX family transcriptional regulator [Gaiellaceae bacterium]|nr:RecX family transcriptional regulator [Gaiellaceae bacterium]
MHLLRERLRERGFSEPERERAIETLLRGGLLDDARYAERRALALAERGAGDALIRHRLAEEGIADELVEEALGFVEPEAERALRVVERRGASAKTARYLSGKGFGDEAVSRAVAGLAAKRLR